MGTALPTCGLVTVVVTVFAARAWILGVAGPEELFTTGDRTLAGAGDATRDLTGIGFSLSITVRMGERGMVGANAFPRDWRLRFIVVDGVASSC